MRHEKPQIDLILSKSKNGDPSQLEELFSWYRPYLRLRALTDPRIKRLGTKLDGSDIAQEALRKAYLGFEKFEGHTEPQLTSWFHTILQHTIEDAVRAFYGPMRDVTREQPLNAATESASFVFNGPTADGSSAHTRLVRDESALILARTIDELPGAQAEAIRLRHIERKPLKEIAKQMEKTEPAIAGLLKRGATKLRDALRMHDADS